MLNERTNSSKQSGESGFTLIFVALILVTLMVFAAMVVDVGGTYAKRRDDQNAADVAALAAVHHLKSPVNETAMVATVKKQAHQAIGTSLTDSQWDSCPPGGGGPGEDPGVLQNQIAFASCVSYNPVRVRVRLPYQYWKTTFGAVVGRERIRHSAFAIAGLEPEGFGGVLPFAVTGASASGGLGCLKSNSNGQASALCESSTGNFGFLNFSHYGANPTTNTPKSCGNGDTSIRIERNTAMGVDHELSVRGSVHVEPVADAPYACEAGIQSPDSAFTQPGNFEDRITNGMFFCKNASNQCPGNVYTDGKPARLQRFESDLFGDGGYRVDDVAGVDDLDDNALWRFIPPETGPQWSNADFPVSCQRNQFVDSTGKYYNPITTNPDLSQAVKDFLAEVPSTRDQILGLLNRCMQHYKNELWDGTPLGSLQVVVGGVTVNGEPPAGCGTDGVCSSPVFSKDTDSTEDPNIFDIQNTSRFGYVPVLDSFPPGGSDERAFERFRAIFIQRLVIEYNGTKYNFDPGFGPKYSGFDTTSDDFRDIPDYSRVGESLVFVFPDGMLPNRLADAEAPFLLGVNKFPELIR